MKYSNKSKYESMRWAVNNKNIKEMELTCSMCPVQFEGKLSNGKYFYFRERHDIICFAIADTLEGAVSPDDPYECDFFITFSGTSNPKMAAKDISDWVNIYFRG